MRSEKQAREGRESERAKGSGRLFVGVWGEGGGVVFIESNHLFALFVLLTTGKPYARPYEVIPTQMPLTSKLGGVGVGVAEESVEVGREEYAVEDAVSQRGPPFVHGVIWYALPCVSRLLGMEDARGPQKLQR
ncbi:hypothetical protein GW17_00017074 [Ensete ventricosum]|nr:hypothetical protein GW17_00017074 [Ensete ventricosum]RZR92608.1 hypothetical protein BHM03_00020947 [Ensete ventricosum]